MCVFLDALLRPGVNDMALPGAADITFKSV